MVTKHTRWVSYSVEVGRELVLDSLGGEFLQDLAKVVQINVSSFKAVVADDVRYFKTSRRATEWCENKLIKRLRSQTKE